MISIVICSANPLFLKNAITNIEATIGVPYEIISYENSDGKKGICEIYNDGAKMAKNEIICYMHEDLDIRTCNWGSKIVELFHEDSKLGLVGVVGSAYKSYAPSGWAADNSTPNTILCNYIQSFKRTQQPSVHYERNPDNLPKANVICIDGLWFCTLKKIVAEYPFDQEMLKGFHGYDIDYSLNVSQKYNVIVTFDILMEHFSEGGYNEEWVEDTFKIHNKWQHTLPRSMVALTERQQTILEKRAYKEMLEKMSLLGYNFKQLASFLSTYFKKGGMSTLQYLKLLYYTLKFSSSKR